MTVSSSDNWKRFHGTDSTGPFTWTWRFLDNDDIDVYLIRDPNEDDITQEVRELLTEGTDYTLTGASTYTGGSLTLAEALATGEDLYVERNTAALQDVSIRNQGNNFRPEIHEDMFDRLTMMVQDRDRTINELESRVFTIDIVTISSNATLVSTSAASAPVQVDIDGLTEVIVVREDDSVNNFEIIDGSGKTVMRETAAYLTLKDETIHLILVGTDWKKI